MKISNSMANAVIEILPVTKNCSAQYKSQPIEFLTITRKFVTIEALLLAELCFRSCSLDRVSSL